MNEPQTFTQADAEWLISINRARDWSQSPLGNLMLAEERRLLCDELTCYFGGYLVHYRSYAELPPSTRQIQRDVCLEPPLPGADVTCEEGIWPLSEYATGVVLLQHGPNFCLSPHRLLREAAHIVRPSGYLLLIGINPWDLQGIRHYFAGDALCQVCYIPSSWVCDWLNLLGFALEKRRFGYYRSPLTPAAWQSHLARLERWGDA